MADRHGYVRSIDGYVRDINGLVWAKLWVTNGQVRATLEMMRLALN